MEGSVVEAFLEVFLALLPPIVFAVLAISQLPFVAILEPRV
jgi:hypothetical protein